MSDQPNAPRRDRLRELLDAVVDGANTDVAGMARRSYGIVAHVLVSSAHRRELARAVLGRHGVVAGRGDPLDWMRRN